MSSSAYLTATTHGLELPTDFELFVAQQRGLREPEAARLLADWLASYQPQRPRPSGAPLRRS